MNNLMQAHAQWASRPVDQRFETLADLSAAVVSRRNRSRSMNVNLPDLRIQPDDRFDNAINVNGVAHRAHPSHWAFGQLAVALKAPANYLRSLPAELASKNLMHGLSVAPNESFKLMTVDPLDSDDLPTLQAVTSPSYGRIWDADCVGAVGRIVERTNGRFHNPLAYVNGGNGFAGITGEKKPSGLYASDHDMFAFMIDGGSLLEAGPRAQLNRGFIVWNSEVGDKTFGLLTFLFNVCCGNHIIYGAQNVKQIIIRHTKGGPARFDRDATPALLDYVNASADTELTTIKRAQAYMLPRKEDDFSKLIAPFKFTKTEVKNAIECAEREEGQCASLWDLVQGFTAYARGFDFIDARMDLEEKAGAMLKIVA